MESKKLIVKAMEIHAYGGDCMECPYGRETNCTATLMTDALKLIEEYEGVI